jgi:hypothetical protein
VKLAFVSVLLVPALTGCFGGGDDDDDGSGNVQAPSCVADEFAIQGTLQGEAIDHRGTLGGHAWIQGSDPSTLDTPFDGGGSLHAEWSNIVADGGTTAIMGTIVLPPSGSFGGQTIDFASGSLTKRDDGVQYQASQLSLAVTCVTAPCPGESVEGALAGCVEWEPIGP